MPIAAPSPSRPDESNRPAKKPRYATSSGSDFQSPSIDQLANLRQRYTEAIPYKYAVASGLLSDELVSHLPCLRNV